MFPLDIPSREVGLAVDQIATKDRIRPHWYGKKANLKPLTIAWFKEVLKPVQGDRFLRKVLTPPRR